MPVSSNVLARQFDRALPNQAWGPLTNRALSDRLFSRELRSPAHAPKWPSQMSALSRRNQRLEISLCRRKLLSGQRLTAVNDRYRAPNFVA